MALWGSNDCVLHLSVFSLADVVPLSHQNGDIEHTQKKHMKMAHSCETIGLCYATANILHWQKKNKVAVEDAVEKNSRKKKKREPAEERTKT